MRIVINEATWKAMIANAVGNDGLHVRTQSGEENPNGYDAKWQVWAKGFEPPPPPPPPPLMPCGMCQPPKCSCKTLPCGKCRPPRCTCEPPPPPPDPLHFESGQQPGRTAYAAVKRFMDDKGLGWDELASCKVTGTKATLADQIASIAQGRDDGIVMTMKGGNQMVQASVVGAPPSEFKEYAASAKRMLSRAKINVVDVSVQLPPEVAEYVLEKLNPRDEANIHVSFRRS